MPVHNWSYQTLKYFIVIYINSEENGKEVKGCYLGNEAAVKGTGE